MERTRWQERPPPEYNPEDDPEWAGRLVNEVATMRREIVNALESAWEG
jgi:hypothetical protein